MLDHYDLVPQRDRYLAPRFGGLVDAEDQLQRFPPGTAVRFWLRTSAQHSEDVAVIPLMTESVDVRRSGRRRVDQLVIVVVIGEHPVFDAIHRRSANLHRALLPEDR